MDSSFNEQPQYSSLILNRHPLVLYYLLKAIVPRNKDIIERDQLIKALLDIHPSPEKFFLCSLKTELKTKEKLAVVMRETSPAVCAFRYLTDPLSSPLSVAFSPLFRFARKANPQTVEMMALETETSRQFDRIKKKFTSVINHILRPEILPPYLCLLCYKSSCLVKETKTFSENERSTAASFSVGALIYLRILVPMLTALPTSPDRKKGCVLVGRFLMKLCCRSEFHQAPGCMLNMILRENAAPFSNYCDQVIEIGQKCLNRPIPCPVSSEGISLRDLKNISSFVVKNEREIEKLIKTAPQWSVSDLNALSEFRTELFQVVAEIAPEVQQGRFLHYIVSPKEKNERSDGAGAGGNHRIKIKDLLYLNPFVCALGKFAGKMSDFGFQAFSYDSGEIVTEVHYAHPVESLEGHQSSPITCAISYKNCLWTGSEDGLRGWNLNAMPGIISSPQEPHRFASLPEGYLISHLVLTQGPIVWCGGFGSTLALFAFNAETGDWCDSIVFDDLHLISLMRAHIDALVYELNKNTLWVAATNFLIQIPLSTKIPLVRDISVGQEGNWRGFRLVCTNLGQLWALPNFGSFIRIIQTDDQTPTFESLLDLSLPSGVEYTTSVVLTKRGIVHTGHWDGSVLEWSFNSRNQTPTFVVFPKNHLENSVTSIAVLKKSVVWTGGSDGTICVWKEKKCSDFVDDFMHFLVAPAIRDESEFSVADSKNEKDGDCRLRIKGLYDVNEVAAVCATGTFLNRLRDFGFRLFCVDTGLPLGEVHYAHPHLSPQIPMPDPELTESDSDQRQSLPISTALVISRILLTTSEDGIRRWEIEPSHQIVPTEPHHHFSNPPGCQCIISMVDTGKSNLIWCSAVGALCVFGFNYVKGEWQEKISLSSEVVVSSIRLPMIGCVDYDRESDSLWFAIRQYVGHVKCSAKTTCTRDMSLAKQESDPWTEVFNLIIWNQMKCLWVIPKDAMSIRIISLDDKSPNFESAVDVAVPFGVERVTFAVVTSPTTIHTGHWDGSIVEWTVERADRPPHPHILPKKHLEFSITSLLALRRNSSVFWSADSEGTIGVWR